MTKYDGYDGFEHVYKYIYIHPFQIKHGYFWNLAVKLLGVYIHNINDMLGLSHFEILSVFEVPC